ncbi:MAG: CopG family transcriptional regulator [Thermodesulfobacteriota bacterium]
MRTTIDIEDDLLMAAKEIARQRRTTIGKVLSDLVRKAMTQSSIPAARGDVPLFPVQNDAGIVTLEMVNRLRDES